MARFDLVGVNSRLAADLKVIHSSGIWVDNSYPTQTIIMKTAVYKGSRNAILSVESTYGSAFAFGRRNRARRGSMTVIAASIRQEF